MSFLCCCFGKSKTSGDDNDRLSNAVRNVRRFVGGVRWLFFVLCYIFGPSQLVLVRSGCRWCDWASQNSLIASRHRNTSSSADGSCSRRRWLGTPAQRGRPLCRPSLFALRLCAPDSSTRLRRGAPRVRALRVHSLGEHRSRLSRTHGGPGRDHRERRSGCSAAKLRAPTAWRGLGRHPGVGGAEAAASQGSGSAAQSGAGNVPRGRLAARVHGHLAAASAQYAQASDHLSQGVCGGLPVRRRGNLAWPVHFTS